ncbi:MAG: hypothetical protein AB1689_14805, partial [Thermodesulfobacteriota bacterium]
ATARPRSRGKSASARSARGAGPRGKASTERYLARHERGLSRSTQRARWIETPDELREAEPGETLASPDHDVIQHWAEERDAEPATVPGTEHDGTLGVLRFKFGRNSGSENLETVDWDEWLDTFDARHLTFLFQETLKSGRQSNFFRLDNPEREDA